MPTTVSIASAKGNSEKTLSPSFDAISYQASGSAFFFWANGKHLNMSTSLSAVCHRWWHPFQLFEKLHLDEESQW
jgi:hypothetical protein